MALTTATAGLTPEQWDDKYFKEYIQKNRFAKEMGKSESNIIQVKEDLTKKKGDTIHFALVNKLSGAGVTGNGTLEGNEEVMDSRSFALTIDRARNGVVSSEWDEQLSAIDLRNAARSVLMDWSMEHTRDKVIAALASINGVAYGSASEANKDAWLVDNADRCLFGAAKSNNSSNDHSLSLANIDNTADKLTSGALSLMKRMASEASPKIRPVRVDGDREYFMVYAHPRAFRDLKTDSTITQAQREVSLKNQNNRLFQGGDIEWDGMIVREIADFSILSGVGAGGIDVAPVYLCGAQAIGAGFARRWRTKDDTRDYEDKRGIAIDAMYNIEKMTFGTGSGDTDDLKDHGVVTGFFAGVADS